MYTSICNSESVEKLKECMKLRLKEDAEVKEIIPINVFKIDDSYTIAVYEGEISKQTLSINIGKKKEEDGQE
ncbi:MAG: hypothetical protein N2Z23_01165 [Pyrinomonadaceae bacterium]|nr:hypothetical protein [Pyrinomonadaceae bacterium]MCX7639041.1 hypothetical protein [Pyrinomonadaceae bacterium]MDW8303738.1 hypothetical protein [Acidobacteriota bacterium]